MAWWTGDVSPVANFRCKAYYSKLAKKVATPKSYDTKRFLGTFLVSLCLTSSMIIYLDVDAGLQFGCEKVKQWFKYGPNLEENWL